MCVSKWCRRPQGPLIRVCGVSIDAYFHGGFNETFGGRASAAGAIADFVKSSFGGPMGLSLIRVFRVSMDASFHGDSKDSIGGLVRHRRPDIPPFSHGGGPIGPHLRHHIRLYTLTFTFGGRAVISSCRHLTAAALSSRSDVIRIIFSLLMSPSLVC